MITNLLVVQKIEENGKIKDIYRISSNLIGWTFENSRTKINSDKDFFPFSLRGNAEIFRHSPGNETKSFLKNQKLTFYDDYGLPAGSVIGIIFPKNYIPDIIKFKDKPFIPASLSGQAVARPPGHIQVSYNNLEKTCAIILHIHENTFFGFKCLAKYVEDVDYPRNENTLSDDLFNTEFSANLLDVNYIETSDLKLINETLKHVDLVNIQKTLNDILNSVKEGDEHKSKSLINKFGTYILNSTSTASSLTTLADSYKSGASAHQFIGRLIESFSF